MSNVTTSVFFETLCVSGSDLAEESFEKDLLIWFGQRDWTIIGMGVEGFDTDEIIWCPENFDQQKSFILKIIDATFAKKNWLLLGYDPPEQIVFENLNLFREMIKSFTVNDISKNEEVEIFPFDEEINRYDRCEIHRVYKNFIGCIICNYKE